MQRNSSGAPTFLDLDALRLEEVAQPADLLLQLADQLGVAVLVHDGLAYDLLSSKSNIGINYKDVKRNVGILDYTYIVHFL